MLHDEEIERKFLLKEIPFDLNQLPLVECERYYFYADERTEMRIQKKGVLYELEHKIQSQESPLLRKNSKIILTQSEWNILKTKAEGHAITYSKFRLPIEGGSIKRYSGKIEGFYILEMEFKTLEAAHAFRPQAWMGRELSGQKLSRDSDLIFFSSFCAIQEELGKK
jgi:adenylate cyclase